MLQKTKVKKIFSNNKVQLPDATFKILDDEIERLITRYAKRCVENNVSRLAPHLGWVALGKLWTERSKK